MSIFTHRLVPLQGGDVVVPPLQGQEVPNIPRLGVPEVHGLPCIICYGCVDLRLGSGD